MAGMTDRVLPAISDEVRALFPPDLDSVGWTGAMGMRFVTLRADEVELEWTVGPQHLQPFGLVHGGVYCGAVETVASVGALAALGPGFQVVGVENQTSFLRAVGSGTLRCKGTPVHVGRQFQLWQANVTDEEGRIVAAGRLRVFCSPRKGP
jgi:1,4-dihydroxy-2-naphthoyl-CoA hydrolase